MSNIPTKKDLKQLAKFNQPRCLTISMPYIEPTGGTTNPNKIMLKNLIKQASSDLVTSGLKPSVVEKTLRPVKALLESREFWPAKRESLAIFAHSNFFKYYSIPTHDLPGVIVVRKGFITEPLQKLAADANNYMVLALGHNNVQLFKASQYEIKPVSAKGFPASMYPVLGIDELPRSLESHTVKSAGESTGSKMFHGQYNVSQTNKTMLLQFFRQVNGRVHEFLRGQHLPLVVAGVDYLLPLYQSVNTYPHLVGKGVHGSPDDLGRSHLLKKAWKTVSQWQAVHSRTSSTRSMKSLK